MSPISKNPLNGPRRAALGGLVLAAFALACGDGEPRPRCSLEGEIGTVCGFENPEDLEYVAGAGVLIVSNMRFDQRDGGETGGYLSALEPGRTEVRRLWPMGQPTDSEPDAALGDPICTEPPSADGFYPHGLASFIERGRALVYVVAHQGEAGGREGVEIFEVVGRGATTSARWKACIPLPPHMNGNDLAIAPDGEVVVSNYQPSGSIWHSIKANALFMSTGDVQTWKRGRGWRTLPGTAAAQPNGIAVSPDGAFVFYTEMGTGEVHRLPRLGDGTQRYSVEVGGKPDNLSWSSKGALLVATHLEGAKVLRCALGHAPCRTPWEVQAIDPASMSARSLLSHDGALVGAVATALEADGRTYFSSVYDDRIGVVPRVLP